MKTWLTAFLIAGLPLAALLGATSVCALFSAAEDQTFGRSHEAITGTVGPRAAQASPYAQNVMRAAGHLGGEFQPQELLQRELAAAHGLPEQLVQWPPPVGGGQQRSGA